jgi:hypothetical protein
MIKLYRKEDSTQAHAIEAEFHEIILGYDRVVIAEPEARKMFGAGTRLPVITNNERIVSGEQIPPYLQELRDLMSAWQEYQGDSCYVNDKGKNC